MAIKLLVVDDSPDVLEMFVNCLRLETDYDVREAASGSEALDMVQEWRPDVIITDLMMPELNGLDLITNVTSSADGPRPQIIAVSGFSDLEEQARRRGAAGFQLKPVDMSELLALIDSLVHGVANDRHHVAARRRREAASRKASRVLAAAAAQRRDFDLTLHRVTDLLARYFAIAAVAVVLLEGATPRLRALTDRHGSIDARAKKRLLRLASDVIESGSALVVSDLRELPALSGSTSELGIRFIAAIPVRLPDGASFGCIMLIDPREQRFDANDLAILQHVAGAGTELLRGAPPPVFLRESGFLVAQVWTYWLGRELAHSDEGRILQLAMFDTKRSTWDARSAQDLLDKLPPRAAIAEIDRQTLLFYGVGAEAESGLDALIAGIASCVGILHATSIGIADLQLGEKTEAILSILEAVHAASRRNDSGFLVRSELRPIPVRNVDRAA